MKAINDTAGERDLQRSLNNINPYVINKSTANSCIPNSLLLVF